MSVSASGDSGQRGRTWRARFGHRIAFVAAIAVVVVLTPSFERTLSPPASDEVAPDPQGLTTTVPQAPRTTVSTASEPAPTAAVPPSPPPPPSAPPIPTVRINAGGAGQVIDGVEWSACTAIEACNGWVRGGFPAAPAGEPEITGAVLPADEALYQTEWTGGQTDGVADGAEAFRFEVPVPDGDYVIRLHFAENIQAAPGLRLFDVLIEGSAQLAGFDIYAEAGGLNQALVRDFVLAVDDGAITIAFIRQLENAKVSAIEVVPAP